LAHEAEIISFIISRILNQFPGPLLWSGKRESKAQVSADLQGKNHSSSKPMRSNSAWHQNEKGDGGIIF